MSERDERGDYCKAVRLMLQAHHQVLERQINSLQGEMSYLNRDR